MPCSQRAMQTLWVSISPLLMVGGRLSSAVRAREHEALDIAAP